MNQRSFGDVVVATQVDAPHAARVAEVREAPLDEFPTSTSCRVPAEVIAAFRVPRYGVLGDRSSHVGFRARMAAAALECGSLPCLRQSKCRGGLRGCYARVARMGMERTRLPVASNTALAMAGAMAMMGVSPAPAESRSLRSSRITSVLGTSRKRGTR